QTDEALTYLPGAQFARGAVGGGTPTMLSTAGLERLFRVMTKFNCLRGMPLSVEMSPETVTVEKMDFLRERGVTRASVGVQSFAAAETKALGRPQQRAVVDQALKQMKAAGFPMVNLDLIYGVAGQTGETWGESLAASQEYAPEEIYLYPLYVRPLTGL